MTIGIDLDGPAVAPAAGGPPQQLAILLHGLGADGHDLIALAPHLGLPHAAFVSPHAPFPCDMAPVGRQWFSLREFESQAIIAGVRAAAPILDGFIDGALAAHGLTDDKLVLVGFSQGCMMALHVALRRPAPCAAVLGFSGMLVAGDELAQEVRARPPVLLVHGDADEVLPVAALPRAAASLRAAGITVEAHVRPGLGHGIDAEGLALASAFLARAIAPRRDAAPGAAIAKE